jgi:hypothetical protein
MSGSYLKFAGLTLAAVFAAAVGYNYFTSEPDAAPPKNPDAAATAPADAPDAGDVSDKSAVQKFGDYYKYSYESGPRRDGLVVAYSKEAPEDSGHTVDVEFMVDENGNTIRDNLPTVSRTQVRPIGIHEKTEHSNTVDGKEHTPEVHMYEPHRNEKGRTNVTPSEVSMHKFRLERQSGDKTGVCPGSKEPKDVQDIIDKDKAASPVTPVTPAVIVPVATPTA